MTPAHLVARRWPLFIIFSVAAVALALVIGGGPTSDAARAANKDDEPELVPGGFGGRTDKGKVKLLKAEGGNDKSEAAVAVGLKWLARHQNVDGSWNAAEIHKDGKCNCGGLGHDDRMFGTVIAVLPFLGAGETAKGGSARPTYSKPVERALKWIIAKQNKDGVLSSNGYIQGMAGIALCEAYGMTKDPQLKEPAQKAINAIVNWQGPDGGFRYAPKQNGDTSVSSWHIQALAAGKLAGLNVPNATWDGAMKFLDKVGGEDGYGYTQPLATQRLTAAGILCRQELGWKADNKGLVKPIEMIRRVPPSPAVKDMYYFYYATQAVRHVGGQAWERWNDGVDGRVGMRDLLVESQDQGQNGDKRDQKGSWDSAGDAFGAQFGRLGFTALCLLTLEVYYRHVPLYERDK